MQITDIDDFLYELYGDEKGWIYSPYKIGSQFEKTWFKWPSEKDRLTKHIKEVKGYADVYLSPVLYNSINTRDFKLSQVVWCDFDEGIPSELGDFPRPSIAVSSSNNPGKQHWYWKLKDKTSDSRTLERYNRQLAYALGADRGCWNFGRVLRPIETLNFKYDPAAPVSLVDTSDTKLDSHVFAALPDIPEPNRERFDWIRLPYIESFTANWSNQAYEFFRSDKPDGTRHQALVSIAITCLEHGLSRSETMACLLDADDRWKKYVGRSDRISRLQAIVLYAEQTLQNDRGDAKSSLSGATDSEPSGLRIDGNTKGPQPFGTFVRQQFHVDWVIENLVHRQGLAIVAAPPGIGKTQFSLNLALHVALGKNFLNWRVTKPRKILFLSLEMMQPELKFYLDKMAQEFTEEERKVFDKNCYFVARQAFRLNNESNQRQLLAWIDELEPDGVFIDSLSRCTGGDLEKGEVDTVFDFLNKEVRDKRKCFLWFVHHNRKANFNQKQPKKLEDLYGSQYIGAYASTVVGLWKITNQEIEVNCLKVWLSKPFKSFLIERTPQLTFTTRKAIEY